MTFLMLLSVGFYQGQETRWVREHKPPGTHSAWGSEDQTRNLGNTGPPRWLWDPSNQHPCPTPPAKPCVQPPGWVPPQMGSGTLVLVATEHRQVVNPPRAPPRDHLVAG